MELGSSRKKTLELFSLIQPAVYSSLFLLLCYVNIKTSFHILREKWAKKIKVYKQEEASQSDSSALATVKTQSIKAAEISWFFVLCFF